MYAEQERSDQLDKPSRYVMNQETGREMRYTSNLRTIKPLAHGQGILVATSATKDMWTL